MRINKNKSYLKNKSCFIFDLDGTLVDSMRYFRLIHEGYTLEQIYEIITPKYANTIEPKAGGLDLMRLLTERGSDCYIATATDLRICGPCIERLGFSQYIKRAFCSTEVGVRKDSPLFYERVLQETGHTKEQTLIFEDSAKWAKVAFESGFDIVGVFDKIENIRPMKEFTIDFIYNFDELISGKQKNCKFQ